MFISGLVHFLLGMSCCIQLHPLMHRELIGTLVGGGVTGILNFQDSISVRSGWVALFCNLLNKGLLINEIIKTWLSENSVIGCIVPHENQGEGQRSPPPWHQVMNN